MIELLATKLFIPRARKNMVSRPRLVGRLNAGLDKKLTLIAAPAGFGKTTLLAEWLTQYSGQVAWVSLDEGDNDPTRFWIYFITALKKLRDEVGESALTLLQSPQPPPISSIITALINDLASFPDDFSIVLDDYHLINTQEILEACAFLLDHLPEQMRIILTARADPLLPLARLRARAQLLELRANDLRFTPDEASAFLNEAMGLRLSAADVDALERRTEGWIAGLQLAALLLQGHQNASGFVHAFAGSNRFVLDYLVEEVFNRRPKGTLNFLLQTSILDRLNGPLCDHVIGQSGSQAMLEELERINLFLVPLDEERKWYRYHHLFAEVLLNRLRQSQPDMLPGLHLRASEWYELNGLPFEAVNHALAAEEWERAASLLEKIVGKIVERVALALQPQTLHRWLNTLPTGVLRAHPILCSYYGTVLMFIGRLESAEEWLAIAEQNIQSDMQADVPHSILGWVALIRADIARVRGDLVTGIKFARQALEVLPDAEALARAVAQINMAHFYLADGYVTYAAEKIAREAIEPVRAIGNLFATLIAITNLGRLHALQGRLHQAAASFTLVEDVLPGEGKVKELLNGAAYYIGLGDLLREWNRLEEADRQLGQGLELVQGALSVDADVVVTGYVAFAKLRHYSGDPSAANAVLDEFVKLVPEKGYFLPVTARVEAARAQFWLWENNLGQAIHWTETITPRVSDVELSYLHEVEYLVLSRVLIAQSRTEEALRLLRRLSPLAEAGGRMGRVIEIFILQALALQAQGAFTEAFTALGRALALAEPQGYIRIFLDEGEPMQRLISAFQSRQSNHQLRAYTQKLLTAFDIPNAPPGIQQPVSQNLVDLLSARELEVLSLVAEGLSNQVIAQKLYLSTGTVKVHLKHIFGKLAVGSRTQAVARARDLNLL